MKALKSMLICASLAVVTGCSTDYAAEGIAFASSQLPLLVEECEPSDSVTLLPRALDASGNLVLTPIYGWTSGFFPGSLWYMYELTGDPYWVEKASRHTEILEEVKYNTKHHDTGFMIGCSYGNGLRLTGKEAYKDIIVQAARSLSSRFHPGAGVIQSWSEENTTVQKNGWKCPVIIDNMMNLELLFKAFEISGDSTFVRIAVSHADNTLKNHFRPDYSSYHVLDYDPETGEVLARKTAQGYSDESVWSRGQAWGLYGFTMCYRYTKEHRYLVQAEHIADFLLSNPNMPVDMIPYWDLSCPDIPDTYRDVSSGTIIASALYELSTFSKNPSYRKAADTILKSLSGAPYRCPEGCCHGFLLTSSVTSIPHQVDIDTPLNYADYYYLEALARKKKI